MDTRRSIIQRISDRLALIIIERSWFRSDHIWTASVVYATRLVRIPFYMDRWALSRSQYWSRAALDRLVERRLELLFSAAATVPLWQAIFEGHERGTGSARDYLSTLPVISRMTFKDLPEQSYLSQRHLPGSVANTTSGSTGVPFRYVHDRGTLIAVRALRDRDFVNVAGGSYPLILMRADRPIQARFHRPHFFYLRSLADIPQRFGELAELFASCAPNGGVLYTFPSMAIALAKFMQENGVSLPVRAVIGSGESVSPEDRALLERVFRAPYMLLYSSLEISGIAFECESGERHVTEDDMYLEILDEHGDPVPDGIEGKITITMFGYRVMPLIRYQNGDIGSVTRGRCACGRSFRTIELVGRTPTLIEQKDGYTITLTELATQLNFFPRSIRAYQIVHEAPDRITVHVMPGPTYRAYKRKIEHRVKTKLHPDTKLAFELCEDIPPSPSGKARYYVKRF